MTIYKTPINMSRKIKTRIKWRCSRFNAWYKAFDFSINEASMGV